MVFDSVPTSSSFQWIIKASLFSIIINGLVQLFRVSAFPIMSHDNLFGVELGRNCTCALKQHTDHRPCFHYQAQPNFLHLWPTCWIAMRPQRNIL